MARRRLIKMSYHILKARGYTNMRRYAGGFYGWEEAAIRWRAIRNGSVRFVVEFGGLL